MRIRLETLNPFRHALEPAVAALVVILLAAAWTPLGPLVTLSGLVVSVLGGRVALDHRGIGSAYLERRPSSGSLSARETRLVDGLVIVFIGIALAVVGLTQV
jgi:hypothetical protein